MRLDPDDRDARTVKAAALRLIAQTTTSANTRSWCLTQARELEGDLSLDGFRRHYISARRILAAEPQVYVHALKVQLEPDRADFEFGVQFRFTDSGTNVALRIRHGVAVPAESDPGADAVIDLDLPTWASLYAGDIDAADAESSGSLTISGDRHGLAEFFSAFDHPHLAAAFGR